MQKMRREIRSNNNLLKNSVGEKIKGSKLTWIGGGQ